MEMMETDNSITITLAGKEELKLLLWNKKGNISFTLSLLFICSLKLSF